MTAHTEQTLLSFVDTKAGRLRLNRPRAINALTLEMVRSMTQALVGWRDDPQVEIILLDHAQGRGFCAGGDVVGIAHGAEGHDGGGDTFFFQEYQMNHLMYTYSKPGAVFMDGITMGGGVGISGPCRYRIATERTVYSMPETGIGLFPDVGGGRYLSRLPGRLPQFLGLIGSRLDGAECHALRLATHYLPSEILDDVKTEICARPQAVDEILDQASISPPPAAILERLSDINRLFASDRLEDILEALSADASAFAQKQLTSLQAKSPLSCKVTLRMLMVSPHLPSFASEMRLEHGIVHHMFHMHDFREGVRALLVDRDNAPLWDPATPEGVTDAMLSRIFEPLRGRSAWEPHEAARQS